ncbi:MAG: TRAP transporter large permease [Methyloceanibacter sp.]
MTAIAVTLASVLAVALAAGVWVGLALFTTGAIGLYAFRNLPIDKILAQSLWGITTSPELLALPLFILMAEILFRTRVSAMLFQGLAPWTTWLPGRLIHVNVLGCTLFAAISGSSAATALTVGRITLSELFSRGYDRGIVIGSLAGAGTLGFLIPPSLIMIIYGVLSETSILKLFIAGILPGLALALGYMLFIAARAAIDPRVVPQDEANVSWRKRIQALLGLLPVLSLIIAVIGSMYGGIASPTEAAAIGVLGALVVSALQRCLTVENMKLAFMSAVRTTCMAGLILGGGVFFSVVMGYLGLPQFVAREIGALDLPAFQLVLLLLAFYLLLGCFLDGTSTIIMTLPITLPLIVAAGFDKIWYGIFLVMVVEMAQITPPIGFNLFVIQALTGEPIARIAFHAIPFFLVTLLLTVGIAVFPEVVLFLPDQVTFRR